MSIERTFSVGFARFLRDELKDHLDDERVATNAEAVLVAEGLTLPAILATSIELGDHPSYAPTTYPAVRIAWPEQKLISKPSRGAGDATLTLNVGVYVASPAVNDEDCIPDLVEPLMILGWSYAEMVRAVIERLAASGPYGGRVLVGHLREVDAPQNVESPCILYKKYEIQVQAILRIRQSRGLDAP